MKRPKKRVLSEEELTRINRMFSGRPPVGGGYKRKSKGGRKRKLSTSGGSGLAGNYSQDSEFGYLVAFMTLDTNWGTTTRTVRDFGLPADGLTMFSNSRMSDADFTTVMSDATHISILLGSNAQGDQNKAPSDPTFPHKGIVYTKNQLVTQPNVTAISTTSAENIMRETTIGGFNMTWHDEDTGVDVTGTDYSFLGRANSLLYEYGLSAKGYNNVSRVGGSFVTNHFEYSGDWVAVWVTNSGVAPVLS